MDNGWIKLHRKLLDSEIFASQIGLKIWLWCLMKASHKKRFIPIKIGKGERTVTVVKGSFIFGRHSAEKELNINGSTVYKWIHKLQDMDMVNIESNNHYSIITICNYESYQDVDDDEVTAIKQPRNSHVTAIKQPRNTYKNVKNVENVKKKNVVEKLELSDEWEEVVLEWLEYKKARRESYKNERSIKAFTTKLKNLSGGDVAAAKNIIEQSFANNWAGIFELKGGKNEKNRTDSETARREQQIFELARETGMA
ncbi:MAG TPA: hypothetical protein VFD00_11405 [Thermoclostridium sp.]|nr:hypothetical protein [Thermoclostridium sp.]